LVSAYDIRCQLDLRRRPGDGLLYSRPGNGGDTHQGGVTDTIFLFALAVVSLELAGLILVPFLERCSDCGYGASRPMSWGLPGIRIDCVHRDRRETREEPDPRRDRRLVGARCLRAWTPVRRRLRAAGRVTQDRLALLASHDACLTLRPQGRHGARGRYIARQHPLTRSSTSPTLDSNIHTG
jgi:hypothetical protein